MAASTSAIDNAPSTLRWRGGSPNGGSVINRTTESQNLLLGQNRSSLSAAPSPQMLNLHHFTTTVAPPSSTTMALTRQQQQQQHHMSATVSLLPACPEDVYTDDQTAYRVFANMPISVFGVLTNLLNVFVFCDAEMRTVLVNHFLLALSISDLFLLLCNFFFLVLPVIVVDTDSFFWNDLFPVIIRYSYPLALTAQTSGVYLTVLVSVHRFLGVCYPFPAKRWCTNRAVQYAIIGSVAFSVLVNVPTWLELSVVACFSNKFARVSRQIALAPFHDMTYILIKKTVVYTFVMFFVPFTILITVNWRIILALRESSNLRTMHTYSTKTYMSATGVTVGVNTGFGSGSASANAVSPNAASSSVKQFHLLKNSRYSEIFHTFSRMSNSGVTLKPDMFRPRFTNSTRDRSVTLMLLAIVALFLFCNGLAFCNSIVESIMLIRDGGGTETVAEAPSSNGNGADDMERLIQLFECSVEISNVLITLNSSTSALIYLIFSSKYRHIVKTMLRCEKRAKMNRVAITTALAAHRAVELSLIPEEADNRKRLEEQHHHQQEHQQELLSGFGRRGKLFRSQTSPMSGGPPCGTTATLLKASESNLRLMENADDNAHSTASSMELDVEMSVTRNMSPSVAADDEDRFLLAPPPLGNGRTGQHSAGCRKRN